VTNFRKAGDIFVCPSRSEGLGNAFLSAMASKLPVVATAEGGLADFLFDEKRNPDKPTTGWVVDKDSPDEIVLAITDILSNPDKVKRVGETARAMVVEKYDWDNIAKVMKKDVFEKVTS
jgi:phosphatidylinositol alpha-1,6-mannosyltransferase